jgi:septum formation protein
VYHHSTAFTPQAQINAVSISLKTEDTILRLILASASPRRKEIMQNAGYEFDCIPSYADETTENLPPAQMVINLSLLKAEEIAKQNTDFVVVGADTIVSLKGTILQKPKDAAEAVKMLKMLSGAVHEVYTGVSIVSAQKKESFYVRSKVQFYCLSDELILRYVKTGEPMDKAGAYGIQAKGALLVQSIEGDYFNIMGLPVAELAIRLKREYNISPF